VSPVRFWEAPPFLFSIGIVFKGPKSFRVSHTLTPTLSDRDREKSLELFLTIVHTVVAVFMILVVLVQGGNSGGVGAAFGGGNSSGVFGATGATSFFGKLTYGAAAIFMITSLALTKIQGTSGNMGLGEDLKKLSGEEAKPDASTIPGAADAIPAEAPKAENAAPAEGSAAPVEESKPSN
jgi:preprotein translocase subunit SecG